VSPTTEEIADEMGLAPEGRARRSGSRRSPPLCANSPVGEEQNAQLGDFVDRRPAVERPPPPARSGLARCHALTSRDASYPWISLTPCPDI
jgi:hypothetical protein